MLMAVNTANGTTTLNAGIVGKTMSATIWAELLRLSVPGLSMSSVDEVDEVCVRSCDDEDEDARL